MRRSPFWLLENPEEIGERVAAHAKGLAEGGHDPASADAVAVAFACVAESDDEARTIASPPWRQTMPSEPCAPWLPARPV